MNTKRYILLLVISLSCLTVFSQNEEIHTDTLRFFRISMYEMFVYNIFDTLTEPCNNEEAIYIFKHRLEQLKKVIEKKPVTLMLSSIIENFEYVTKIESESNMSSYGKLNPTENDIKRWQKWLDENKNTLCWYEKEEVLYVKKEH